jgi:hypothetical protein
LQPLFSVMFFSLRAHFISQSADTFQWKECSSFAGGDGMMAG